MTIVSNVKGYINGEDWGIFEKGIPLPKITWIYSYYGNQSIAIRRADPNDTDNRTWVSSKLIRKQGSAPQDSNDGVLVTTETVKNSYYGVNQGNSYVDKGLDNGVTYYYKVFTVDNRGGEVGSNSVYTTPDNLAEKRFLGYGLGQPVTFGMNGPYPTQLTPILNELNRQPNPYYNKFQSTLQRATYSDSTVDNILFWSGNYGLNSWVIRWGGSSWEQVSSPWIK